mgnify:CR=1 FL=1
MSPRRSPGLVGREPPYATAEDVDGNMMFPSP